VSPNRETCPCACHDVRGRGVVAPLILNRGTGWRWVVSFIHHQLCPKEWLPVQWVATGRFVKEKNFLPLSGIEPRPLNCTAHTAVTILTISCCLITIKCVYISNLNVRWMRYDTARKMRCLWNRVVILKKMTFHWLNLGFDYSASNVSEKRPVCKADNIATSVCRLSGNSGSLKLLVPQGHAQAYKGLVLTKWRVHSSGRLRRTVW